MLNGYCEVVASEPFRLDSKKLEFKQTLQDEWSHRWEQETVTYGVKNTDKEIGKKIRLAMNLAMTIWDKEIELNLKWVKKDPDITVEFVDPEDDELFTRKPSVLAYAYFPATSKEGIMVFNTKYIWSLDGELIEAWKVDPEHYTKEDTTKFRTHNLIHVLIHEIGHSLGLRHDSNNDTEDVMDPYYSGRTQLSESDKLRIIMKYGARHYAHSGLYDRLSNWIRIRLSRF